jgi:hypothetical protein
MKYCRICTLSDGQHIAGCPGLRGLEWDREKDKLVEYDDQGREIVRRPRKDRSEPS